MYIYGFSYHSTFPTFLGNVKTIAKSSKMINIVSFGIVCLSYMIISLFGYLYKNEVPEQLFLDRINEDNNFLNIFLKIVAFIFLFSLIPHRYITIRDGYKCLLGNDKFNDKIDLIFIIICLFIANIIVFLDQEIIRGENSNYNIFSVFTNIFGGLLGVIIAFLLPVINFAAINGKTRKRAIVGYIISAIFIIVGIISVIYSFYKIDHSENKN
jgi:protein-S-isoprenylcysteine O-methyltransferase Ste14